MSLNSEEAIKKKLNIDSWRNLSRDKFMSFVAEMPKMDREVALGIVAQFPNFKNLVTDAFEGVRQEAESAHRFNWKSQKRVHEAYATYRAALNQELSRDDLSREDRFRVLELFREAVRAEDDKDSQNKAWGLKVLTGVGVVFVSLIGVAFAALGGKFEASGDDNA